ncbi:MAG: flagellar basal body P-ring formation protein FlgA [Nitrospirae bacterium]|nr:flagellar basal body P-ring formation protein FlgA [Nitrospirota bacterium]
MLNSKITQKCLSILTVLLLVIIVTGYDNTYGADAVKIMSSDDVENIIKEYVIQNSPWTEDQINVKNVNISNKLALPAGWSYNIKVAPSSSMIGRSSFLLDIAGSDNSFQSSWVTAEIEVLVEVVLASKPLKERQMVGADDIYIGRKDLSRLPAGYISDINQIPGKRVKRFVGTNSILTENILEEPPLFKKGEKVFIVAESASLKVIAVGVADEDGYRGRPVRITNTQSRKEVIGEVDGDGSVSVKW